MANGKGLTKPELYFVAEHLASLRPPGPRPLTSAQLVMLDKVLEKFKYLVELMRNRPERGKKVLEWRISCAAAPTQNEVEGWRRRSPFLFKRAKEFLQADLERLIAQTPDAHLFGAQKRRWIRVTRFTSAPKNVDEDRIDAVGGKLVVDVMKHCGVIHNDSPAWLMRRAHVLETDGGNKHILVELFEVAELEVPCPPPQDGPAPPNPFEPAIKNAGDLRAAILKRYRVTRLLDEGETRSEVDRRRDAILAGEHPPWGDEWSTWLRNFLRRYDKANGCKIQGKAPKGAPKKRSKKATMVVTPDVASLTT